MVKLNIEIGCPPGNPRPNEILMNILSEIKKSDNQKIIVWANKYCEKPPEYSILMGDLNCDMEISNDIHDEVQNFFKTHLTEMYYNGLIRFASW